jgi:hypothetical protein
MLVPARMVHGPMPFGSRLASSFCVRPARPERPGVRGRRRSRRRVHSRAVSSVALWSRCMPGGGVPRIVLVRTRLHPRPPAAVPAWRRGVPEWWTFLYVRLRPRTHALATDAAPRQGQAMWIVSVRATGRGALGERQGVSQKVRRRCGQVPPSATGSGPGGTQRRRVALGATWPLLRQLLCPGTSTLGPPSLLQERRRGYLLCPVGRTLEGLGARASAGRGALWSP